MQSQRLIQDVAIWRGLNRFTRIASWCGIVIAGIFTIAGCGSDERVADVQQDTAPLAIRPETNGPRDPSHPVVAITTSTGTIRVKLDAVNAPSTVRNFLYYTNQGFYDGTLIHFVAPDKMIVGGGYSAGREPKLVGTTVRNEADNGLKNTRGTIAMARDTSAGIDTATTQFFINLADSPAFDHRGDEVDEFGYCVFGEVVDGLDVAEQIGRAATSDHGGDLSQTPEPPVVVRSISVVE